MEGIHWNNQEESYDEEDRNAHIKKKNRKKYIIIIVAVLFVLLLIIGVILAVVLSNKKTEKSFDQVGRYLTISFFTGQRSQRDAGDPQTTNFIINAINSSFWTQL